MFWFPALNVAAVAAGPSDGFGGALLVAALLAELFGLIAWARRCGVGNRQVAVALLANVGSSVFILIFVFFIWFGINCGPNCDGLS